MMAKYYPLKAFGIETLIPRWAVSALAAILVAGVGWMIYQKVYADPESVLVSLKDANKQLALEVEEYGLHAMEEPQKHELFEEQDGKLLLRVFKDHCVLIQRHSQRGVRSKLVLDLARASGMATRQVVPTWNVLPVVEASGNPGCQRGCLNPHPGEFRWWYGQQRNGWVEVWRQWPEGCQHVQLFHPRSGSWESNPDGSAKVRWVCCVH